jgi:hypothetical protein
MLSRICTYPISDDHRAEEIETIKKIAKVNGYGKKFIDKMYQHHLKKKQLRELITLTPASDEQTIKRVAVPFQESPNKNGPLNQRQTWRTSCKPQRPTRDTPKIGRLSN